MRIYFDSFRDTRDKARQKSRFSPNKRLRLTYVYDEPDGWPLTRPATPIEWAHVLKVMIMRRVPRTGPIHQNKLLQYVSGDLQAASTAGKIYVNADFYAMRRALDVLKLMYGKDRTLRTAPRISDPEMFYEAPAIYRTEFAEEWIERVPVVVRLVVDYLPATSVLDLMVQALIDDD